MLVLPNHAGSSGIKPRDVAEANFRKVEALFQKGALVRNPTVLMSCSNSRTSQLTGIGERPNITATIAGQRPTLI